MKKVKSARSLFLAGLLVLLATLIFSVQSCVKKYDFDKIADTEYSPNFAVPLVYSSMTIQDLITKSNRDGLIQVGADHFCTLVYNGNLFSLKSSDILGLPDQSQAPYSASLTAAQIAALTASGSVSASFTQTVNFVSGTNNPKIDSLKLKTGTLNVSLNSDFRYSGNIKVTIPSAKKNGAAFVGTIPFKYTGFTPVTATGNFNLTGYTFDMTQAGTTYNQFDVKYDLSLSGAGTPPLTTDMITISQSLNNMSYNVLYGDIGQIALSPNIDTVELSIFKNALGTGTFSLVDPSVKVTISNSYGVPISASIAQLDGYNPPSNTYPITGSPNPLPILSPNFTQIGQSLAASYTLSNTPGCNIVSVINNTPKNIIYQINSLSNPAGPTHNNFVTDSSRFKVDLQVNLPFWGTAQNFALIDTLPLKLEQGVSDSIESILFKLYNSNGFPLDMNMQAYLTDSNYVKLDSLVIPNQLILKSASVNGAGLVTSPTEKTYDMVFDHPRLKKLKGTAYMLVKAVATTTNGGGTNVKIYSTYKLDVKLGVQVQVKINIKGK